MARIIFHITLILGAVLKGTRCMTIGDGEEVVLPDELKPIVRGGSWFDDTAIERLKRKHQKLKESGTLHLHSHEDDSEEMFILAKLGKSPGDHHHHHEGMTPVAHHHEDIPEIGSSVHHTRPLQSNGDSLRLFLRNHRHDRDQTRQVLADEPNDSRSSEETNDFQRLSRPGKISSFVRPQPVKSQQTKQKTNKANSMTTDEFLNHYEKELHNFFRSFMNAMLKAEIHEVRIEEKHSTEDVDHITTASLA